MLLPVTGADIVADWFFVYERYSFSALMCQHVVIIATPVN